jgi:hypothetical protein
MTRSTEEIPNGFHLVTRLVALLTDNWVHLTGTRYYQNLCRLYPNKNAQGKSVRIDYPSNGVNIVFLNPIRINISVPNQLFSLSDIIRQ